MCSPARNLFVSMHLYASECVWQAAGQLRNRTSKARRVDRQQWVVKRLWLQFSSDVCRRPSPRTAAKSAALSITPACLVGNTGKAKKMRPFPRQITLDYDIYLQCATALHQCGKIWHRPSALLLANSSSPMQYPPMASPVRDVGTGAGAGSRRKCQTLTTPASQCGARTPESHTTSPAPAVRHGRGCPPG